MKRGRDEEKIMGPMFPRLHVNDTDKGGPRAPPRNKMALYEQLSIPSQRFSHALSNTAANLVPQSSQGGGNERGMFFSQQMSPRHPPEKQYSQYSDLSSPLAPVGQRKQKLDKDDFTVPIFIDSVPNKEFHNKFSNDTVHMEQEELSSSNPPYFFNHTFEFPNGKGEKLEKSNSSFIENTERNSSNVKKDLPSQVQNIVNDVSVEAGSREDGSFRSLQTGNLERTDSVSETSMLDNVSGLDMTPDDAVGIIGHKHFWKARRAIVNQQRVFSVQVFELHRLIKVQRSIAASPHLLQEDSPYMGIPSKAKKLPSANISKPQKPESQKQSHKKEASAENTIEKAQSPRSQNRAPPPSCKPSTGHASSPPSVLRSESNPSPWSFNHMQVGPQQWLIPVMSPSEGLVYKPMMMGSNFIAPAYGVPAPHPQYHFPSYPPGGTHGYFPSPYSMPVSGPTAAFSGSSVEQRGPTPVPDQSNLSIQNRGGPTATDVVEKTSVSEDLEVQASSASSRTERLTAGSGGPPVEGGNMLPLFPTSPAGDNCSAGPENGSEGPTRVIKVVPHNGISASESAARIFRSIQEERKQYDSV